MLFIDIVSCWRSVLFANCALDFPRLLARVVMPSLIALDDTLGASFLGLIVSTMYVAQRLPAGHLLLHS
jgi:hypothetical protein